VTVAPGLEIAGRYRLEARLNESAPAGEDRWRATDIVLARPVMLSLLEADPAEAEGAAEAGLAVARLAHPNIAAVYDTAIDANGTWVVSELPHGRTLRRILDQNGPLPPARVAVVGAQMAGALAAAHRMRVTHGALSPEEVIVSEDDRVKVGGFAGTGSSDADVRAAAVILYTLLCGHGPTGSSPARPRDVRPGVPPGLEAVVLGALGIQGARWTAEQVASALSALDLFDDAQPNVLRDATPPVGIRPVARVRKRRWAGGVAAAVIAVGAIAAVIAALAGGTSGRSPAGSGTNGQVLTISGTAAFSPPPAGGGHENDAKLALLHDGSLTTFWSTQEYASRQFGNLKPGVGVVLELDGPHALRDLTIVSPSRQWSAEVFVADRSAPDLSGWGTPAGRLTVTSTTSTVGLGHATGAAVLLWITDLGSPNPNATTFPYRVDIDELIVHG
jgi:eukaryotic-like serine/threonine-protein kinase